AAMDHAIGTFLVVAGAVRVPVGLLHQLLEGLGIAFAEEIAGALPAEIGARRIAPGRAVVFLVAGEEIEEQRRLAERPLPALAQAENVAEQLLGPPPAEEMLLVRGALIGIAWRHRYAVEPHRHDVVEELRIALGVGAVEEGAVDVDAKATLLRQPD